METEYLTTQQAAERMGVTAARVQQLFAQGRIPGARRFGGKAIQIPADALDKIQKRPIGRPRKNAG